MLQSLDCSARGRNWSLRDMGEKKGGRADWRPMRSPCENSRVLERQKE